MPTKTELEKEVRRLQKEVKRLQSFDPLIALRQASSDARDALRVAMGEFEDAVPHWSSRYENSGIPASVEEAVENLSQYV